MTGTLVVPDDEPARVRVVVGAVVFPAADPDGNEGPELATARL